IKIRGFRVELSEIEIILMRQPEIKAAVVALREDTGSLQQLVAYIVPRDGTPPNLEMIRSRLRAQLPVYMMPVAIELLSELPTLPSGKIDRKALPPPSGKWTEKRNSLIPPRTTTERQLAGVWEEVFAVSKVSVDDN